MKCKICGCPSSRIDLFLTNIKSKLDNRLYHYFKCSICKTIFLNPLPKSNWRKNVYNNPSYYMSWEKEKEKNLKVRRDNDSKKVKVFKIKTGDLKGKRILDLGCAFGTFLELVDKDFKELYGVEYSDFAIKHMDKKKIKASKTFFGKYPPNFFDVVTMWDVIEHTPDPKSYITEIYRILKKGGYLVLTTPNSLSYPLSILKEDWPEIQPPEHVFFMNMSSLGILLRDYAHVTMSCSSRYHLNPPIGFYSIFAKLVGLKPTTRSVKESEQFRKNEKLPIHKKIMYYCYYQICKLLSLPFNAFNRGDSLLVVARK